MDVWTTPTVLWTTLSAIQEIDKCDCASGHSVPHGTTNKEICTVHQCIDPQCRENEDCDNTTGECHCLLNYVHSAFQGACLIVTVPRTSPAILIQSSVTVLKDTLGQTQTIVKMWQIIAVPVSPFCCFCVWALSSVSVFALISFLLY